MQPPDDGLHLAWLSCLMLFSCKLAAMHCNASVSVSIPCCTGLQAHVHSWCLQACSIAHTQAWPSQP